MSSYRGRGQGVNVSQFLANLNTYYSAEELVDTFDPSELALFTNTQFFDFDMANPAEESNVSQTFNEVTKPESDASVIEETDSMKFLVDYGNFDYSQVLSGISDVAQAPAPNPPAQMTPLAPQDSAAYSPTSSPASPATTSFSPTSPAARNFQTHISTGKRKSIAMEGSPGSLEEASRLAAEEDKRRRNTAASARFRIKKKQREQTLERTAKEMTERVGELQTRINQLEMENKWLKNLITEKNGKSGAGFDIAEIFNAKFSAAAAAAAAAAVTSTNPSHKTAASQPSVPVPSQPISKSGENKA